MALPAAARVRYSAAPRSAKPSRDVNRRSEIEGLIGIVVWLGISLYPCLPYRDPTSPIAAEMAGLGDAVAVADIPGRGRGLIAARDIREASGVILVA